MKYACVDISAAKPVENFYKNYLRQTEDRYTWKQDLNRQKKASEKCSFFYAFGISEGM